MSRFINFTSGPACAQNNPYFQVQTIVPQRYLYEYLEQLIVSEFGILPVQGKSYNLYFQDYPQLAELFNITDVQGNITLTFADNLLILDFVSTSVSRVFSGGLYSFIENVGVGDLFLIDKNYVKTQNLNDIILVDDNIVFFVSRNTNLNFLDFLSLEDNQKLNVDYKNKLFIEDNFGISEIFNFSKSNNYFLKFMDACSLTSFENILTKTNKTYILSFFDLIDTNENLENRKRQNVFLNFKEDISVSSSE